MNKNFILKLYEIVKTSRISTREMARKIFNLLPKEVSEYTIDFSQIEFISRSFADEMMKIKKSLMLQNKKLEFQNMQDSVKKMIEIVSHQIDVFVQVPPSVAITETTTLDQL